MQQGNVCCESMLGCLGLQLLLPNSLWRQVRPVTADEVTKLVGYTWRAREAGRCCVKMASAATGVAVAAAHQLRHGQG